MADTEKAPQPQPQQQQQQEQQPPQQPQQAKAAKQKQVIGKCRYAILDFASQHQFYQKHMFIKLQYLIFLNILFVLYVYIFCLNI